MSDRAEIVWDPPPGAFASSQMGAFARHAGRDTDEYTDLHRWSIDDVNGFWGAFADWAGIRWQDAPGAPLAERQMPATWFRGGTLNYADQILAGGGGIISLSQSRGRREMSGLQLAIEVARCRRALEELGVRRGDRVAAYLPNIPETIVAFLATASLGAIWSSCAPEFGVRAVVDRFSQLDPTVLLTIDGYRFGSKSILRQREAAELVNALSTVRHVVVVPYLDEGDDGVSTANLANSVDRSHDLQVHSWTELMRAGDVDDREADERDQPGGVHVAVPFDHPLYVLFSSGTTGLPKPIVHCHGGIVLEHLKVHRLHHDLRPHERFMWFTTTGWMMWNYLVSALATGATIVCFDGDPVHPGPDELWRVAAEEHLDIIGVSAAYIMSQAKLGLRPAAVHDLTGIRQVGSTGSPLPADGYRWVRQAIGDHVQTSSISGGTDLCTAIVGSAPSVPVRAGEISVSMLGCDVRAFAPDGSECPVAVTGELVLASPLPSMPVGFWGDTTGERYRSAYFETFPGVWHHGDWITFFDDGACQISGRSDATLNRGGVRLGTGEFYAVVESLPVIDDSLVIHLEDPDGGPGQLLLFVVPAPGVSLDDNLERTINETLRSNFSPRHKPDAIETLPAVPRTLSGKKLEVPIKRLLLGHSAESVVSRESLADPAAWDAIVTWASTRTT